MSEKSSPVAPVKISVHTPGPWKADCFLVSQVGGKQLEICHTGIIGRNKPGEQAEADARLIAAAPQMKAIIEKVYDAIHRGIGPTTGALDGEIVGWINDEMCSLFGNGWHSVV